MHLRDKFGEDGQGSNLSIKSMNLMLHFLGHIAKQIHGDGI